MRNIYRLIFIFVALAFSLRPIQFVFALDKSGVGAFLSNSLGDNIIEFQNIKATPRSEVFIENGDGIILATAQLTDTGEFSFPLSVDTKDINNIYIYIVDSIGSTPKIGVKNQTLANVILPPTIAQLDQDISRIHLYGFTFPNSIVSLTVSGSNSIASQINTIAQADSGKWNVELPEFNDGVYTARVTTSIDGIVSESSDEFRFEYRGNLVRTVEYAAQALLVPVAATGLAPIGLSLDALYSLIFRIIMAIRGLLSLEHNKRRRFGVVYDALTKQPITGAIVRLLKSSGKLVETEVTGSRGIFSFLPVPGNYMLKVVKSGYSFPTQKIISRTDGEYSHVYHGEIFQITSYQDTVGTSVPLDAIIPPSSTKFSYRQRFRTWYAQWGIYLEIILLLLGFSASLFTLYWQRGLVNGLILFYYLLILSASIWRFFRKKTQWSRVIEPLGRPVSHISLALFDTTFHRLIQRRLSDEFGRFQFLIPKGSYLLQVTSAGWELVSAAGCYKGEEIKVSKDAQFLVKTVMVRQIN